MSDELVIGIVIAAAVIAVLVWVYNSFVRLRVRALNAWADIDVQLRRRRDLVPNLVETVRGYAEHEKHTFEEIARLRSLSEQARTVGEQEGAENSLEQGLKTVFALAESYPNLRAAENFQDLQKQLVEIEDALQHARRYYNAVVRDLNTRLEMFPIGLLGRITGFKEREYFQAEKDAREAPAVQYP
jgi:LemA protein